MKVILGILGGGQLGRMSAMAAARLGVKCVIFCPEGENSPAGQVSWKTVQGDYNDNDALSRFAQMCDFITYEFENIPISTVEFLQKLKPVHPDAKLLEISQDRAQEKAFLNSIGIETAPWKIVNCTNDIPDGNGILKTLRMGYDGKGQAVINENCDKQNALALIGGGRAIWEGLIDFKCEISVIIARDISGKSAIYDICLNEHKNAILHKTTIPCGLSDKTAEQAKDIAQKLANEVNLVGVATIELFVTQDDKLLANEIAPRAHNSGHWSIDACAVSQFENHIRAAIGLNIAQPNRHSDAIMENLIGAQGVSKAQELLKNSNACVHLYGKDEAREGRKIGHVTRIVSPL